VNPARSNARCSAVLVISVEASIRCTCVCANKYRASCLCASVPVPRPRASGAIAAPIDPAVRGPGDQVLAPGHKAEPLVCCRHYEHAAVIAEQPVFRPLAPEPAGIPPAEPLVLPGGRWVAGQPVQERQVVLGHRPQEHPIVHGRTCYDPGAACCAGAARPGRNGEIVTPRL